MFFWKSLKIYTSLEADKYLIKGFCISQPLPPQCLLAPWDVVFGGIVYRFQKASGFIYRCCQMQTLLPLQEKQGHRLPCSVLQFAVQKQPWQLSTCDFDMACFLFQTCMYRGICVDEVLEGALASNNLTRHSGPTCWFLSFIQMDCLPG